MPPPIALSKTRLLSFLQCPRKLWLEQYSPELEDEDAIDWAAIKTGNIVGEVARRLYGAEGGHRISNDRGLRAAVTDTAALLDAGGTEPVFEATFDFDGLTVQIDVLDRSGPSPRLIEVKSATRVKDHYLHDCAIQAWTLTQCGQAPGQIVLAHVDSSFCYRGGGDYAGLLHEADVTSEVADLIPTIPAIVADTRAVLDQLDEPETPIGTHCTSPYVCPFFEHCAPPQGKYPVTGLGGNRQKHYEWMREGFTDLRDVPADRLETDAQRRIQQCTQSEETFLGTELKTFAAGLPYPRYFLDFETIAPAVPIWPDTRPYEALPFQWSCHVETAAGEIEHREFLDAGGDAPMRACAMSLIEALGDHGTVLVYTDYESRVLKDLGRRFPDLAPRLAAIADRFVDLHPLAKANYYHPAMLGSWSIKAIVPTVAPDLDYGTLGEVRDGQAAQAAYLEAIAEDTTAARRDELRSALSDYCRYDTLALLRLLEFFASA